MPDPHSGKAAAANPSAPSRTSGPRLPLMPRVLLAALPVVLVVAAIELFRLSSHALPAPFLLLLCGVVFSAALWDLAGGLTAGLLASTYILYASLTGFGPEELTGTPLHTLIGVGLVMSLALLLGRLQHRSRTYRTRLEEELGARNRALVRNAPEAITVADAQGRIIDCNPQALALFGLEDDPARFPSVAELSPPRQADGRPSPEAARGYIEHALTRGPISFEWLHRHTDGTVFPCEVSLSLLPDREQLLVRGAVRDITQRKRAEALRAGEYAVLQSIARGETLSTSLDLLARLVERVMPETLCSIIKLNEDGETITTLAGPSLPEDYNRALNGLSIGPEAGSCGTAMYRDMQVITEDIESDPRWEPYRPLARQAGLRACWSTPIHDSTSRVLGSFALYYRQPRLPTDTELDLIERLTSIAGIAMERYRNSETLRHREELYRATFEHAAVGIAHLSPTGKYLQANPEFCRMLGYGEEELAGLGFREITHPDEVERDVLNFRALEEGDADSYYMEKRWIRKDGSTLWVNMSVGPVRTADGRLERYVVVAQDVSSAHDLSLKLSYQARHDALTGLINREEFEHRLAEFLQQVLDGDTRGAFCYLDLDQFKLVNDTAGHVAGDELLRQIAPRLRERIRESDTLARLGGDEFGVLLIGCDQAEAAEIAGQLCEAVEDFTFVWKDHSFKLGVSIGVVPLESDALTNATDVLQAADTACYAAKDAGRNRFMLWREDDASLYRRRGEMQWIPRLNRAMENDSFRLVAQPIAALDATEGPSSWHELLVRLQENGETIPPGAFLPAAERYGFAPRLDRMMVGKAIDWLSRHPGQTTLSVNLSGQTFCDPGFRAYLIGELEKLGGQARRLCFEITETAAIGNLADALRLIEGVRRFGCLIALDDFGSGLSSFAYLKNLPVDILKIDGSFIRDIARDPIDMAIVQSIQEVAQVMGKITVAEFVESEQILKTLRQIGVDYAQGFHIGHPRPLETIDAAPDRRASSRWAGPRPRGARPE